MLGFFDDMTPGKAVVGLCAGAVMLTVWVLNAIFTFTYGVDIIGPFLLETQLGPDGSAMLSGLVALIFYDFSYTVAFMVLLFACRSNWQYAVIGIQFALCFIGSVMASAASIIILSPLGNEVPGMALIIARYLSYGGLIIIFVVNALATVGYIVTRPEMFAKIQESIHQASQTADTERFTKELRKKARMMAHDLVRDDLPDLAAQEAAAIRTNFVAGLPERASDGRALNITQKEYQWKAPTPKAGKAVKETPEKFAARPTKNGRHEQTAPPAPPYEQTAIYEVYKKLPGNHPRQLLQGNLADYWAADGCIERDSREAPTDTQYMITSNGRMVATFKKVDQEIRPIRPQRQFE